MMFKSIEFLTYDNKIDSDIYKLIDTEFECEVVIASLSEKIIKRLLANDCPVTESVSLVTGIVIMTAALVTEYKKRSCYHKEIVKNIFKYNLLINNHHKYYFERLLNIEMVYIDRFIKNINFSKLYYEELKDMWDNYKCYL